MPSLLRILALALPLLAVTAARAAPETVYFKSADGTRQEVPGNQAAKAEAMAKAAVFVAGLSK